MPKNQVTDPITDQEIAFARLVLSGTMTDRRAAETAGLNPDTAAYTKSKPRVRAYLLEHRAAVREKLVDQDADQDADQERRLQQTRERILARLWEIADLDPEKPRGNLTGHVKALSVIAAIEGLIPERRAVSLQNKPTLPLLTPDIYESEWLRDRKAGKTPETNLDPAPTPPQQETASGPPSPAAEAVQTLPTTNPFSTPATPSLAPRVPMADHFAPDTRVPFSIKRNPFRRY